jgi:hypothetical protein
MERLDPEDYSRLRPLFAGLRTHLVVDSMIEGNTPAWVFADDPRAPRVGLMWDRQDGLLLAGDPGAADDLASHIARDLRASSTHTPLDPA